MTVISPLIQEAYGVVFTYQLVGEEPYVRLDGRSSAVLRWRGICVVCGNSFECLSFRAPKNLPRSCGIHRPWTAHASICVNSSALFRQATAGSVAFWRAAIGILVSLRQFASICVNLLPKLTHRLQEHFGPTFL